MRTDGKEAARGPIMAGAIYISVLLAAGAAAGLAGPGWAQVPDNRDLRLDPEDSVSRAYGETLDARDGQRLDAAREAGETFLPLFQGSSSAPEDTRAGDPWAEEPRAGDARASAAAPPQPAYEGYRRPEPEHASGREPGQAGDFRPEGLVNVLIEAWTRPPEIVRVRWPETLAPETLGPEAAARAPGANEDRDVRAVADRERRAADPILPRIAAGTGLYARTMYAVDSDYPGPVLLEILEPPLAGAVASGAFTLVGERLVLRLGRLEYRGRSFVVDAWAAGLDCACYGVDGEVDSHWFERVLLPSAVRFAEGFLSALSRPSETVTIGEDVRYERRGSATRDAVHAGLATAARTAGDVLLESAPDGPTVRIARDTELVVVFAAPPDPRDGRDG
ncbi:MAG: DotG/IcmE/VirB10 family protein [Rhodospirillales bacterium]|nr:DotG/IcmE/VirB10 family protein [Rhodospirillales bacterium]